MKKTYSTPELMTVEIEQCDCILSSNGWYDETINEYGNDDIYGGLL